MSLNVDDYTISELLDFIKLNENNMSEERIIKKTDKLINKYKTENNKKLTLFFQKVQYKLLLYLKQTNETGNASEYTPNEKQTNEWWSNEALKQKDKIQNEKITERKQKIDVYDNEHVPMKKQELGVNNTFALPVAQDKLNPNLENITKRIVNLDSQFRQASGGINSISTDYTLDLSDPLTDVISLNLYSIQIPYTWYVIDYQYGNTCMWVVNNDNHFLVSIEPGNYTATNFVSTLNTAFLTSGFTSDSNIFVSFNANNGKISLYLGGSIDPNGNIINENMAYFLFFDFTGEYICTETSGCQAQNLAINGTLGWLMGFRLPQVPILTTNTAPAVLDLYGTKYLILVIDDFNQNHINNGLVTITEISNVLDIPPYYNPTTPHLCTNTGTLPNELQIINNQNQNQNIGFNLTEKITLLYKNIPTVLPTAPRTLTQAQIYSVNQIIKNREKTTSYRGKAPTSSDTFALIPVKHSGMSVGDVYVEFSGSLQDNQRIYFGPVDISRMHIKLLDDRGFTLNLHGSEWSVTLVSTSLYQY